MILEQHFSTAYFNVVHTFLIMLKSGLCESQLRLSISWYFLNLLAALDTRHGDYPLKIPWVISKISSNNWPYILIESFNIFIGVMFPSTDASVPTSLKHTHPQNITLHPFFHHFANVYRTLPALQQFSSDDRTLFKFFDILLLFFDVILLIFPC